MIIDKGPAANRDGSGYERIDNQRTFIMSFFERWLGEVPISALGEAHAVDISFDDD